MTSKSTATTNFEEAQRIPVTVTRMTDLQKLGGIGALTQAGAYLFGFTLAFTVLAPAMEPAADGFMAFVIDNQPVIIVWYFVTYIVAGTFMVPMVLAIHERLKEGAPALAQISTAFGIIWTGLVIASGLLMIKNLGVIADLYAVDPAQAATVRIALSAVESALGGGIELPGGVWILLVSVASLRARAFPRPLNYLGILVGGAGIITVVPALREAAIVFGLGFIAWFIGAGITMLRTRTAKA